MPDVGKGGGPVPFSNAFKGDNVNSLRYNTSDKGSPLHVCYGTQRLGINVIAGFGFTGKASGSKKGGSKGGSKTTKKGGGTYSVNVAFAACQGPVSVTGAPQAIGGYNRVWADGGVAGADKVGMNFYAGNDGQAPDPVFASSGDLPILGYSGTAYATGTPLQLGSTPALPNVQIEVTGFGAGTCGTLCPGDARPDFIVVDMLTNARYGCGFPIANLDTSGSFGGGGSVEDWGRYCQAQELAMSFAMDHQQPAARWLEEIAQMSVTAVFWSGSLLKFIPYGDGALSNNGAAWTPDLTWRYALGDDDFLGWTGSPFGGGEGQTDPVIVTRRDPSALPNWINVEYQDTAYAYNREVVPVFDQASIDQYGVRVGPSITANCFTNPFASQLSGQLQLQRMQYIRNTYKFKLGWRYSLLEPMDIVLLYDATLGLAGAAVRIIQIDEDDNGELTVTAEEIPGLTP